MPMIFCSDCSTEISDSAPACPKCGKPNNSNNKTIGLGLGLGIFFMPYIFAWLTLRKGYSDASKYISFFWLIIIVVFIALPNKKSPSRAIHQESNTTSHQEPKTAPKSTFVNIRTLLADYKNNEINADNKYKDRLIQTKGVVSDVKKIWGDMTVSLGTGARFEIPDIQATFDDSMSNELAKLNKRDVITITCVCSGLTLNVHLEDCVINPPKKKDRANEQS